MLQIDLPVLKDIELSNMVWAHAKLFLNQREDYLQQCASEFTTRLQLEDMTAQSVSNMTWSLAKLGVMNEDYCWVINPRLFSA